MSFHEEGKTRELFNVLRTGEQGVSFEAFMKEVYFLQHHGFTIFDAKEAFHSCTAMNERFLTYRDFQFVLAKLGRMRYATGSDAQLIMNMADDMIANRTDEHTNKLYFDSIRKQMIKHQVLDVLELQLPKLVQSFHLYGRENTLPKTTLSAHSTLSTDKAMTISTDGFVDFLNAYFEYEEFFSFTDIEKMVWQMKQIFVIKQEPPLEQNEMLFPQFLELFCRVASQYHTQVLHREGARLRRAVESCRLEFSIELLLQHMNIKIIRDDAPDNTKTQSAGGIEGDMTKMTVDDPHFMEAILKNIKKTLENCERVVPMRQRPKRAQSLLFSRLPPRRANTPTEIRPATATTRVTPIEKQSERESPTVTLIRELITPPSMSTTILKKVEHAISYQNMGQFHMALGILGECKARFADLRGNGADDAEAQLFFCLMIASVCDSARRDYQALEMYHEALQLSEQLPPQHPGRSLAKSSLGCMLFYCGEYQMARQCHQMVLDQRKATPEIGDEHIDTATAMNNLACCLSQGNSMEEAFLLLKTAAQIYRETFGSMHPRTATIVRNLERVKVCQQSIIVDAMQAYERGDYMHVIPGSRFQINALVPIPKPPKTTKKKKKGSKGTKKKK